MNTIDFLQDKENFENYNLVITVLALTEDRFDLYFKMTGESIGAFRDLCRIRDYCNCIGGDKNMGQEFIPLNKDGTIQNYHYKAAVAIIHSIDAPGMTIQIGNSSNWRCDREWLEKTYTKKEVNFIESKRMALLEDFKRSLSNLPPLESH